MPSVLARLQRLEKRAAERRQQAGRLPARLADDIHRRALETLADALTTITGQGCTPEEAAGYLDGLK
jgi:hypothetical protein